METAAAHWKPTTLFRTAMLWLWDPRWFFATMLFLFSAVGRVYLGFWTDWSQALVAIGSTVVLELMVGRLMLKKWVHPVSAVMTGISLSILLTTPPHTYWPYLVGPLIAIGSKYTIRYKNNHVLNPSNTAVVMLVLFVPQYGISNSGQWTNHIVPGIVILSLGLIVAARAKRLDVVAGFVIGFILLAGVRSWIQGLPLLWTVGPAMGAEFLLFTFFMLTDPKTSPRTHRGRLVYGITVAVLDALFRIARVTYSPLYALTLTCLAVPFLNHHLTWSSGARPGDRRFID